MGNGECKLEPIPHSPFPIFPHRILALMISITPYGAAGEVTGSAYLVETDDARVLVDLGMFQGDKDDDAKNVIPGRVHRSRIDAIVLTHGHLDHSGRIPLLVREGFDAPIFATDATKDIAEIILFDAANIQESDYQRRVRDAKRRNRKISRVDQPLYDRDDAQKALELFTSVEYGQTVDVAEGITATFHEAGHMLGSASITLSITEADRTQRVVFSGDVGPVDLPFLRDPIPPHDADVVVMESTYGDRDHRSLEETESEFAQIIQDAVETKGKIFIPSFAIGRAQNILFYLAEMIRNKQIPRVPIILDSPMAIEASYIYARYPELFDEESTDLVERGQLGKDLKTLSFSATATDSKAINDMRGPFIVIAGSGMCTAGRILHHLRNNVTDPKAHIVIVGFQARGSLGRYLVEGAEHVRIMGHWLPVRAKVHTLGGFSAHAGRTQLRDWLEPMVATRPRVILTHGEDDARTALAALIQEEFGLTAELPVYAEHLTI